MNRGRSIPVCSMRCMLCSVVLTLMLCVTAAAGQDRDEAMLANAMRFLGTPYVAHTLDVAPYEEERLVVNCEEVDCTTFVEYVLALSLSGDSARGGDCSEFVRQLTRVRYRDGRVEGYASRLHYFSDWIDNGLRNGFLTDVTATCSSDTLVLHLSYMSSHPESYPQLASSPDNFKRIAEAERRLSGRAIGYLPKDKLPADGLPWIHGGDIVAIVTSIEGLDIAHVGIAVYVGGRLSLLHASQAAGRVIVSSDSLADLLAGKKSWAGIRVVRRRQP